MHGLHTHTHAEREYRFGKFHLKNRFAVSFSSDGLQNYDNVHVKINGQNVI